MGDIQGVDRMTQRPLIDIEEEVIQDYMDNMSVKDIEKRYGWTWSTLRKILKRNNVAFRPHGGSRNRVGRIKGKKNKWGG